MQRLSGQLRVYPGNQFLTSAGLFQFTPDPDPALVGRVQVSLGPETKFQSELGIVTELRMGIQRQVIAKQTDVILQQQLQTFFANAGHGRILATPEVAVMNKNGICPLFHRGIYQRLACRHPCHQCRNGITSLHLQTVWTIIAKFIRFQ